jgi:hypothetical protein
MSFTSTDPLDRARMPGTFVNFSDEDAVIAPSCLIGGRCACCAPASVDIAASVMIALPAILLFIATPVGTLCLEIIDE